MRIDELTEIEIFRMAVSMAATTLIDDKRLTVIANPDDLIADHIRICHSAVQLSAQDLLGRNGQSGVEH